MKRIQFLTHVGYSALLLLCCQPVISFGATDPAGTFYAHCVANTGQLETGIVGEVTSFLATPPVNGFAQILFDASQCKSKWFPGRILPVHQNGVLTKINVTAGSLGILLDTPILGTSAPLSNVGAVMTALDHKTHPMTCQIASGGEISYATCPVTMKPVLACPSQGWTVCVYK